MKPRSYGPFAYSALPRRAPISWPGGARVALWVILNIEFFSLAESVPAGSGGIGVKPPDVPSWAARDYGNRVGVFRLMKVLDRYGIHASVALNADICMQHPEIIEECQARKWEFMGHNESNTRRLNELPAGEEHAAIRNALDTIERATGARPRGWLGAGLQETWNTLDFLAVEGCEYVCDWPNDDQPYLMTLEGGGELVSVPYSLELNDKPAYEKRNRTADEFHDMIVRQFRVLYEEGAESGRVVAIALHPYLSGVPHRIGALDAALQVICRHEGVWRATGGEIAREFRRQTPRA
jgi:peptidoglycan/xylan/chitin deacetylase (PgdA/CDA1 family)